MIQADDPRLKTAEGWVALGAPKDATHWIGPHEDPWEKHEGNNRVTWIEEVKQWSDYTFAVRTGVDEISCDYTVIPRPISAETISELTLEPMTGWAGDPIDVYKTVIPDTETDEYKALLKLSRKFGLGTSLTINIAPGVCSIHDNHGDEFRFPIERAQEVIEAWGIVEAVRLK